MAGVCDEGEASRDCAETWTVTKGTRTLRITPVLASGLRDHVWSIDEIVGLLEMAEKEPVAW